MSSQNISLAGLFDSVVNALQSDQGYLNHLDQNGGNGNHGSNVLQNFEIISNVLHQNPALDNRQALDLAAQALLDRGQGQTARIYANGLRQAASNLGGSQGLSAAQIIPLLQGLLGGVQSSTDARPGQGTLLDSLVPGIESYLEGRSRGLSSGQSILNALSSALQGAHRVQQGPAQYGRSRRTPGQQTWIDPGAASGATVLRGLLGHLINA